MASFDVVSEVDRQEVRNAVDQAQREIGTRFDFKNTNSSIEQTELTFTLRSVTEDRLTALRQVLEEKLVKRGVSLKGLDYDDVQEATQNTVRQVATIKVGISSDKAREINRLIKEKGPKGISSQTQGETVRVNGKKRDDLQATIALIKGADLGIPVQFENFRDDDSVQGTPGRRADRRALDAVQQDAHDARDHILERQLPVGLEPLRHAVHRADEQVDRRPDRDDPDPPGVHPLLDDVGDEPFVAFGPRLRTATAKLVEVRHQGAADRSLDRRKVTPHECLRARRRHRRLGDAAEPAARPRRRTVRRCRRATAPCRRRSSRGSPSTARRDHRSGRGWPVRIRTRRTPPPPRPGSAAGATPSGSSAARRVRLLTCAADVLLSQRGSCPATFDRRLKSRTSVG